MGKQPKVGIAIFILLASLMLLREMSRRDTLSKTLNECSIYTVGNIYHVYTLRGMSHAKYTFSIAAATISDDESVNNFDTGEPWLVDMKKLAKRRLFLQINCTNHNVHRILWHISVPDTLNDVPKNGWREKPDWAENFIR
ncbi:hypothetical protein GO730_10610 [Spirosoma sp. HMF3257]|uniref:Uncharacterized protein n=1 Tax=Spirosoma telluris TaxID=2183553 RepID=A0A327NGU4_9BACT|nr:hypothetical protein [Spirosoma telluris]RAI74600.1 hypothetical protein HMF3257_10545 [Spirosoma telluris]